MPAISFFADDRDVNLLVDRFNADPEIAFLVPDGPLDPERAYAKRLQAAMEGRTSATFRESVGVLDEDYRQRWKAVSSVETLADGNHSLWHIPAGPLRLPAGGGRNRPIPNPWVGWTEELLGAERIGPHFGGDRHAVIELELWTRHRPYSREERASLPILWSSWDREDDQLVASSLQWIGGYFSAPPVPTRRWWDRLKAWFRRTATPLADGRGTFWAFPSALWKLKGGMAYDSRGFNLSRGIKTAVPQTRCPKARDLCPPAPVLIDPAWLRWNGGTIPKVAEAIYADQDFGRLPVLADALEEAGCTNPDILSHCRGAGPHIRGCWVVDLLRGRTDCLAEKQRQAQGKSRTRERRARGRGRVVK